MGGANAQDPQGWKRPWGLWGVGLRLKEQKGPRHAPHPLTQRAGDLTWEPSRLSGLEWAGQMPSPLLLLQSWRAPPACLSCSPLGLLPMPPGPMWLGGGGPWRSGNQPGSSAGSLGPSGGEKTLHSSPTPPRWLFTPASPYLPCLKGADPVWLPLLLPPQFAHILLVLLGVPPISLGIRVPQQCQQPP